MQRRALSTVVVAALLVTAGCAGLGGDGGSDGGPADAGQVASDAREAMQSVQTYRMVMEMNVSASGRTLSMRQRGVFNKTARRARLNMTVYGTEGVAYLDNATMYVNVGGRWRVQDLSGRDPWTSGSGLARQRQLLETGSVNVTGTATVDGVRTTVLTVDPKASELKQLLSQGGTTGLSSVSVQNATYRLYVANESDLPRKVELSMELTVQGQSADANVTITFSEYGEPVHVSIPEGAPTESSASRLPAAA
ncbi:MAG: hypothetical protein ABEJ88_01280 [Halobacterium sp.]